MLLSILCVFVDLHGFKNLGNKGQYNFISVGVCENVVLCKLSLEIDNDEDFFRRILDSVMNADVICLFV